MQSYQCVGDVVSVVISGMVKTVLFKVKNKEINDMIFAIVSVLVDNIIHDIVGMAVDAIISSVVGAVVFEMICGMDMLQCKINVW